ncbi:tripartite tricarboxylate transporter substrate binding protein [Reyranella sp. CPCC 100927]|uniref:Bug family tripartite tricarboxylate transporter substrate binding protein n=1 Tax=Reyranella sp. CPCC 100927 TaxID=2599616 RepID=UPI0011B71703|nr:tripartite tricarboxylate transporter substrate binding protein [Reyranella sp. CPCC 100927]TWT13894.1 tripartite tricarboxylate transporter substrate binding protein [Reyranella sp. CPCC 100927]
MSGMLRGVLLAFLMLFASAASVSAADYPSKPVRWIVAFPPGGGTDFLARTVAVSLSKKLGQPVVIENRPGAAGIIGAQQAAVAAADGYTIFSGDNGSLVLNPALYAKLPYKAADFAPVGMMARFPLILVTAASGTYATVDAVVAAAKADPTKVAFASPGAGSPHHLAMELLKVRAGFEAQHIAYKGGPPAVQDVLTGQVPIMMVDTVSALPHLQSGKLKALAVAAVDRLPYLPDAPTFKELGYDGVDVYGWQGLVVPAATPQTIRDRLTRDLQASLADPDVQRALTTLGLEVTPSDGAHMSAVLEAETTRWHALIRERGLKLEQ